MHAHINPFNPLSIAFPLNTTYVDWSLHYPALYKVDNQVVVVNTKKYPVKGDYKQQSGVKGPAPQILDIGCGYGGLMF